MYSTVPGTVRLKHGRRHTVEVLLEAAAAQLEACSASSLTCFAPEEKEEVAAACGNRGGGARDGVGSSWRRRRGAKEVAVMAARGDGSLGST